SIYSKTSLCSTSLHTNPLLCFASTDTHCLCYDFTITPNFRPEPRWCEVQGLVDERPFLHYDCVNHKAKAFVSLGKKVNVTKTWEKQTETLGDVVDFLNGQLPDIQVENLIHIGKFQIPLILQAQMSCDNEAYGHNRGSWQFLFNRQTFFLFDSNNRKWAVLHPGAKKMNDKWEKNTEVTMFFHKISMGDCKMWLEEVLIYWEKMLDPTNSPLPGPGASPPLPPEQEGGLCCHVASLSSCVSSLRTGTPSPFLPPETVTAASPQQRGTKALLG
uniref:MHC class I-like antigen recognition-like domain-containing protein n=1 Tax=Piliocolobus tephrosceles TaxID=591936 RepID=A0A8C9GL53_9PRIM